MLHLLLGMNYIGISGKILELPKVKVGHFSSKAEAVGRGSNKIYINLGCPVIRHKQEERHWSFSLWNIFLLVQQNSCKRLRRVKRVQRSEHTGMATSKPRTCAHITVPWPWGRDQVSNSLSLSFLCSPVGHGNTCPSYLKGLLPVSH